MKLAPVRKSIYRLPALAELMGAANRRYLECLSALDDVSAGVTQLDRVTSPVREGERTYRGFNFIASDDVAVLRALVCGEFTIAYHNRRQYEPPALLIVPRFRQPRGLRRLPGLQARDNSLFIRSFSVR